MIGTIVIIASYLLYPTVHGKTSTKTQIMVIVAFATGLINLAGEFII